MTLSPACSAESEIEGWVRGMWGRKDKRQKEREEKIDDTGTYSYPNRLFPHVAMSFCFT